MHQGLQTVMGSRSLGGAVVHQLVFGGKNQSHLERLLSHSHRSARGSILSKLQGLRIVEGFHALIRDDDCGRAHIS